MNKFWRWMVVLLVFALIGAIVWAIVSGNYILIPIALLGILILYLSVVALCGTLILLYSLIYWARKGRWPF